MRGERILFFLSVAYISGNLINIFLIGLISDKIASVLTCTYLFITLSLLIFIIISKQNNGLWFLSLFFVIGSYGVTLYKTEIESHQESATPLSELFSPLRKGVEERLKKLVPPEDRESYGILKALTIGDKGDIGWGLKTAYRKSGAMHLLALSGLHVGIIYSFLGFILAILGRSFGGRVIRGVLIILFLWFYALFTGLSPSITRAVLMATIYETGGLIGREKSGLNSLGLSAMLIAAFDPEAPSSISFQLSYGAMVGIFAINPHLSKIIDFKKIAKVPRVVLRSLWGTISISISCQILTTPLTLFYFRSFAPFSLLTNLIAIPLTNIIMVLILSSLLFMETVPIIGEVTSKVLWGVIKVLNFSVGTISQLQ